MSLNKQTNIPIHLVSLSGGGYRAALFHCGVLRALHLLHRFAPDPPPGMGSPALYVSGVSGGAISASLWRLTLAYRGLDDIVAMWPERMLLDLIDRTPAFGGKWNWFVRRIFRLSSWKDHIDKWWMRTTAQAERNSTGVALGTIGNFLVEFLDFRSGELLIHDGEFFCRPEGEFFEYGPSSVFWPITLPITEAIAASTAVPGYFAGRTSTSTPPGGAQQTAELVDGGVVDNQAVVVFAYILQRDLPPIPTINWVTSHAGGQPKVPKSARSRPLLGNPVAKLSLWDFAARLVGDLSQPITSDALTALAIKHRNATVTRLRAGLLPYVGNPWLITKRFPTAESMGLMETTLGRIARDDAIAVMSLGAETASAGLGMSKADRATLRAAFAGL